MLEISWLAAKPVSFSRRTLLHGVSKYGKSEGKLLLLLSTLCNYLQLHSWNKPCLYIQCCSCILLYVQFVLRVILFRPVKSTLLLLWYYYYYNTVSVRNTVMFHPNTFLKNIVIARHANWYELCVWCALRGWCALCEWCALCGWCGLQLTYSPNNTDSTLPFYTLCTAANTLSKFLFTQRSQTSVYCVFRVLILTDIISHTNDSYHTACLPLCQKVKATIQHSIFH